MQPDNGPSSPFTLLPAEVLDMIVLYLDLEGVKSQFSNIKKNNKNCTSETAIWALVVPLVVGCLR